ncbi:unnamed protein product [Linum trigynum]|uniref:TmcB/TmcC TPR repeats domain-containing protein n=1 Tax=Linum trigynum TaxID=586398 RepID=A0AAV2EF68_9ROSI
MLLRTSSSPGIKGAVFTVLSESPVRGFHHPTSNSSSRHHQKNTPPSHLSLPPFSPPSPSSTSSTSGKTSPSELNREAGKGGGGGFRKAWSDSNIDRFAASSACDSKLQQESLTPRRYPPRKKMLHSAPSFSIFTTTDDEEVGEEEEQKDGVLMRTVTIGENIGSGEFSFGKGKETSMELIEEVEEKETGEDDDGDQMRGLTFNKRVVIPPSLSVVEDENQPASPPMYLATGLGLNSTIDFQANSSLLDFDDGGDLEEYYRKMLDQFPTHPLFLRNYAHLLQSKGDLHGAEEYYHRATQVEPGDGEILMQYAKLVWELHRDCDRAMGCFERAAQAAPQDSNVLGAYASFLWEIDEDEGDEEEKMEQKEHVHVLLSTNGEPGSKGSLNVEDYYKQMVREQPNNALVLRNYAQFLSRTKGDMQGAEEYYSRAILADPSDGEIMSQYAKLVWELHRDQEKASPYFERAVEAAPADSHVLAAYASFLWELEEDEEATEPCSQLPGSVQLEGANVVAAN